MRMLLSAIFPAEPFNQAVLDGTAGEKLGRILETIRPEAVYFTEQHGRRSAILIVDVPDPSRVPSLAEPFFLLFNAHVEFRIVMTPEELRQAGLEALGRTWAD